MASTRFTVIQLAHTRQWSGSQATNEAEHWFQKDIDVLEEDRPTPPVDIDYRCPLEPRSVPDSSLDVLYSRAILEHVCPHDLDAILGQAFRMIRPGGLMVHLIDNSDHFQHRDRRLGPVNFLRYDVRTWGFMCLSKQNYQNRLRHSDYWQLIANAGFEIVAMKGEPDANALFNLETLPLSQAYAGRARDDLAILTSLFVARRPKV